MSQDLRVHAAFAPLTQSIGQGGMSYVVLKGEGASVHPRNGHKKGWTFLSATLSWLPVSVCRYLISKHSITAFLLIHEFTNPPTPGIPAPESAPYLAHPSPQLCLNTYCRGFLGLEMLYDKGLGKFSVLGISIVAPAR